VNPFELAFELLTWLKLPPVDAFGAFPDAEGQPIGTFQVHDLELFHDKHDGCAHGLRPPRKCSRGIGLPVDDVAVQAAAERSRVGEF